MRYLFVVGAGGAMGSISRYLLSQFIQGKTLSQFPFGTLTVNLIGCFFIGMIYAISTRSGSSAEVRLFFATGLCGGFTTFSAFSNETVAMLHDGQLLFAGTYIAVSVAGGIAATLLAIAVFK
jgi:CrcB protein